jgi:type IV secretion system protein TrbG
MKALFLILMTVSLPLLAGEDMAEQYFSKKRLAPTTHEQAGLAIAKKWQGGYSSSKPFTGKNGEVTYAFTDGQIQIMCAVLQVCDIELEPGEATVDKPMIGDPRFKADTTMSGTAPNQVQHITIKVKDTGLDTTMVVPTNRRTYHFRLRSDRIKFMPYVKFTYDNEEQDYKWRRAAQTSVAQPTSAAAADNIDFGYTIQGNDFKWKPKDGMVYNDGVKTYIKMPGAVSQGDAPALLVLKSEGGLFSDDETAVVNYRLQNNRFIVDSVFDKAILVVGAGENQEKVMITREGKQ